MEGEALVVTAGDIDAGNGGGDDFSLPDPSTCVPVFDVVIGLI